jgi:hypothetical protein
VQHAVQYLLYSWIGRIRSGGGSFPFIRKVTYASSQLQHQSRFQRVISRLIIFQCGTIRRDPSGGAFSWDSESRRTFVVVMLSTEARRVFASLHSRIISIEDHHETYFASGAHNSVRGVSSSRHSR